MADAKISSFASHGAPVAADYVASVLASGPTSKRLLMSDAQDFVLNAFGGGTEIAVTGTVTATIGRMHHCTGITANYTVTLPAASGNTGKLIGFRMGSAAGLTKLVTIDGNAAETIDGATTRVMWSTETAVLMCDGSNWHKIAGKSIPFVAEMKRNTAQSIASTAVTVIDFNAVEFDVSGLFASTTNDRFDCPRSALYSVTASWYPATGLAVGKITQSRIHAGTAGSTTERKTQVIGAVTGAVSPMNIVTAVLNLAAGEVIQYNVYHDDAGAVNTSSSGEAVMARMTVVEVLSW